MNKQKKSVVFLIIPLLFLLLFTIFPFLSNVRNSFYSMSYTQNNGFVGLENYNILLNNSEFQEALYNSFYYTVAAIVQVLIALIMAVILADKKRNSIYKAFIFAPYLINGIAIGYIFRVFFSRGSVFDTILGLFGIVLDSLPYWLRDQEINNWVLAFVSVWRYTGLSFIIFLGAIQSIEKNSLYAAKLDGVNAITQFVYIIWPNIKRVVLLNLFLSIVSSLSEFEIPYAVASGGANGTATYMILIYRIAFIERKIGLASAMTVTLLCQIIVICWAFIVTKKTIKKIRERGLYFERKVKKNNLYTS